MKKFYKLEKGFLISNNSWRNLEYATNIDQSYHEERDRDKITEIKLRYLLKDENAKQIVLELKKIRNLMNTYHSIELKNNGYGDEFEIFSVSVLHDLDYIETIKNYQVYGKDDGKVDIIYYEETDKVHIYQIKIDNHNDVGGDRQIIETNYSNFIYNKTDEIADGNDLISFLESHRNYLYNPLDNRIKKEPVITIISSNKNSDIKPMDIFKQYFSKKILPMDDNNIQITIDLPEAKRNGKFYPNYSCHDDSYLFFMPAKKLLKHLIDKTPEIRTKENIHKYFYGNVRGDLGPNLKINKTIEMEPNNFVKYNNGVTITGVITSNNNNQLQIANPCINNGQQTILSLLNNYDKLDGVNVIVVVKNEAVLKNKVKIARYTNDQKKVDPINLLSLNKNLREIQKRIFDETFLEKLEDKIFLNLNTAGSKGNEILVYQLYGTNNTVRLNDFIKLYFGSEDKKLGSWKNEFNRCVEELLKKDNLLIKFQKSLNICKIIISCKKFIKSLPSTTKKDKVVKNDLRSAELAFMYLCYNGNTCLNAHKIIKDINNKYFYKLPIKARPSKLIDLYKTDLILEKLEKETQLINQK